MTHNRFGPLEEDMPKNCPACDKPIKKGQYATLISLGPGDDKEAQQRCRDGRSYNAIALPVHLECATGEVIPIFEVGDSVRFIHKVNAMIDGMVPLNEGGIYLVTGISDRGVTLKGWVYQTWPAEWFEKEE